MNVYKCTIAVKKTGYLPGTEDDTTIINVLAKNLKHAISKASTYRLAGEVKKTTSVVDATLVIVIDK